MTVFEQELIDFLLTLEGNQSNLAGDTGGWTYRGLSERFYPQVKQRFAANDPDLDSYVEQIYLTDYLQSIYGYDVLVNEFPWLVKLLFPAKVHGAGDEHIIEVVQRQLSALVGNVTIDGVLGPKTLRMLLSLSNEQRLTLRHALIESMDELIQRRVSSVGGYENGIANRVRSNFMNAFGNSKSINGPMSERDDNVKTAKLSVIVNPTSAEIVSSDGWEDLPLGLDLTIEIRNADYASNIISTSGSLQEDRIG
jgi:lysozyme family protein